MEIVFEELDYQQTPLGDISLRKRSEPRLENKLIYEVKLGDEFLMSSLFVEAEEQLSTLGLQALAKNGFAEQLDVVVGGLGLGYTALTALNNPAVKNLRVIDVMQAVISWHQQGLLPIGDVLATNDRCVLVQGDFFAIATEQTNGFLNNQPVHAVFLDIDHSPSHWLNDANSDFYSEKSLAAMANKIVSGGVFGLWSNELPDPEFVSLLNSVFSSTETHIVRFANPYSGGESINSVYIASVA
ncbi:MAG: hypothetical protein KTR16_10775 [Acidiferrobacterales bacterium]|nr:hypothetical protein [Acidiferrobacterales bacterium]